MGSAEGSQSKTFDFLDGEHITHIDAKFDDGHCRLFRIFTSLSVHYAGDKRYLTNLTEEVNDREVRALAGRYSKDKLECLFFYYSTSK